MNNNKQITEQELGFNFGLEYAADWIEKSGAACNDEPRTIEFAKNMAMSIRAQKKPWGAISEVVSKELPELYGTFGPGNEEKLINAILGKVRG